jgi:hypothetical protein
MKTFLKKVVKGAAFVPAFAMLANLVAVPAVSVYAATGACSGSNVDLSLSNGADCTKGTSQATDLFGDKGVFRTVVNILVFLVGAISVIMLVIGGIRYVLSGGDQAAVTGAKNTILYAIVGIVVAFLAYGAVQFVTSSLINNTNTQ